MATVRKVVSDASKLPESNDHAEILKQVEFYFSDTNLPTDKFLWQATQKNDGWVSIDTIHQFKRMRRFQPLDEVVAALKESPELLEVSEDGKNVRRRVALKEPPSSAKKDAFGRTVYSKGFGPETETSQFDLEKWFGQYGPVKQVRLRRTEDGTFKESVFVEFTNLEDANKYVEAKPKYQDKELLTMSKQAYVEMKAAQQNFADTAAGKRRRPFNAFHSHHQGSHKSQNNNKRSRNDHSEGSNKKRAVGDSEPSEEPTQSTAEPEAKTDSEAKPASEEAKKPEENTSEPAAATEAPAATEPAPEAAAEAAPEAETATEEKAQ